MPPRPEQQSDGDGSHDRDAGNHRNDEHSHEARHTPILTQQRRSIVTDLRVARQRGAIDRGDQLRSRHARDLVRQAENTHGVGAGEPAQQQITGSFTHEVERILRDQPA